MADFDVDFALERVYIMITALENIRIFFGERGMEYYLPHFEILKTTKRVDRVWARISSSNDKEQLADYLAEIRYALIFIRLGFEIEFEPLGNKGPDLGIHRDNQYAVVEIKRFRKVHEGPPLLDLEDEDVMLTAYGDIKRDTRKSFERILDKFPQIGDQKGIIAIWNDDEDLEEIEILMAVSDLINDSNKDIVAIPGGLLFVLYGSKWIGRHQFYAFPFQRLEKPFDVWKEELDTIFA